MITDNAYWKNNCKRKIEPEDVLLIRALREEGLKIKDIAEKFELSSSQVGKIVNRKTWRHIA